MTPYIDLDDLSDRDGLRVWRAYKEARRIEPPRPTQEWATRALLYRILADNDLLRSAAVLVVMVGGINDMVVTQAHTSLPGDSVWRLLYAWPHGREVRSTLTAFETDVLREWAKMGEVIRARIRYEQREARRGD